MLLIFNVSQKMLIPTKIFIQTLESDFILEKTAFNAGFNKRKCLQAWEKVGAAPATQKCLDSGKVRREFGNEDDEMNKVMKRIQEQNDQCTFFLTHHGYDRSVFTCKLNKKKVTAPIHNNALKLLHRQGHMEHCSIPQEEVTFLMMFFKRLEISVRENKIKAMETDKAHWVAMQQYTEDASAVLKKIRVQRN